MILPLEEKISQLFEIELIRRFGFFIDKKCLKFVEDFNICIPSLGDESLYESGSLDRDKILERYVLPMIGLLEIDASRYIRFSRDHKIHVNCEKINAGGPDAYRLTVCNRKALNSH